MQITLEINGRETIRKALLIKFGALPNAAKELNCSYPALTYLLSTGRGLRGKNGQEAANAICAVLNVEPEILSHP